MSNMIGSGKKVYTAGRWARGVEIVRLKRACGHKRPCFLVWQDGEVVERPESGEAPCFARLREAQAVARKLTVRATCPHDCINTTRDGRVIECTTCQGTGGDESVSDRDENGDPLTCLDCDGHGQVPCPVHGEDAEERGS